MVEPILLYIPGVHDGYFRFFSRHEASDTLLIVGSELARSNSTFHAEIREVDPQILKTMFLSIGRFTNVEVVSEENIQGFETTRLVTAREEVSRRIAEKYFPNSDLVVDDYFLRYDAGSVKSIQPVCHDSVSSDPFDFEMMDLAFKEATNSSDWWRHVGSVVVINGKVVAKDYNRPVPSLHMPYLFGNPRDFIEAGTMSQFSDALHSEKGVAAQLLQKGISAQGAWWYVSVFPCPDCAKLIAYSGAERVYFGSGHASLDGERILKEKGVKLIYVPVQPRT